MRPGTADELLSLTANDYKPFPCGVAAWLRPWGAEGAVFPPALCPAWRRASRWGRGGTGRSMDAYLRLSRPHVVFQRSAKKRCPPREPLRLERSRLPNCATTGNLWPPPPALPGQIGGSDSGAFSVMVFPDLWRRGKGGGKNGRRFPIRMGGFGKSRFRRRHAGGIAIRPFSHGAGRPCGWFGQ